MGARNKYFGAVSQMNLTRVWLNVCTSLTGLYISLKLHMCFLWSKVLLCEMSWNTSGHKMSQVDCLITSSILFRKILKAAKDTFGNGLLVFLQG